MNCVALGIMLLFLSMPVLQASTFTSDSVYVIVSFTPECPICQAYLPRLKTLITSWKNNPVHVTLLVPDAEPDTAAVHSTLQEAGLGGIQLVFDSTQSRTEELRLRITPEAVVLLSDGTPLYQGRIDNLYERLGVRRRVVTSYDLRDAVDRALGRGQGPLQTTIAVGCVIERR
jgi:thiol-disulfide isomerase/thioredoxin